MRAAEKLLGAGALVMALCCPCSAQRSAAG
jgi:hypothetical protein